MTIYIKDYIITEKRRDIVNNNIPNIVSKYMAEFFHGDNGEIDPSESIVDIGNGVRIQNGVFHGLPKEQYKDVWDIVKYLETHKPDIHVLYETDPEGSHGHRMERITLTNADGSLVFSMEHVRDCRGPGASCSYSHGPKVYHGQYNPRAIPNVELKNSIMVLKIIQNYKGNDNAKMEAKKAIENIKERKIDNEYDIDKVTNNELKSALRALKCFRKYI